MFWRALPPNSGYNEQIFAASIDDVASEDTFKKIIQSLFDIAGNEKHIIWFINLILAIYKDEFPEDYKERISQLAIYELHKTDSMRRERVAIMKMEGYKIQDIADHFKISRQAVYNILKVNETQGLRCSLTRGELNDVKAFLRAYTDLTEHLSGGYLPNAKQAINFV